MKRVLVFLLLCFIPIFSVEIQCGKRQFHYDNDLVYDCFFDEENKILGSFMRDGSTFIVHYINEEYVVGCYHKEYSTYCPGYYYECLIKSSTDYSYTCKTKKKAKEIKNRLKRAK